MLRRVSAGPLQVWWLAANRFVGGMLVSTAIMRGADPYADLLQHWALLQAGRYGRARRVCSSRPAGVCDCGWGHGTLAQARAAGACDNA